MERSHSHEHKPNRRRTGITALTGGFLALALSLTGCGKSDQGIEQCKIGEGAVMAAWDVQVLPLQPASFKNPDSLLAYLNDSERHRGLPEEVKDLLEETSNLAALVSETNPREGEDLVCLRADGIVAFNGIGNRLIAEAEKLWAAENQQKLYYNGRDNNEW